MMRCQLPASHRLNIPRDNLVDLLDLIASAAEAGG